MAIKYEVWTNRDHLRAVQINVGNDWVSLLFRSGTMSGLDAGYETSVLGKSQAYHSMKVLHKRAINGLPYHKVDSRLNIWRTRAARDGFQKFTVADHP